MFSQTHTLTQVSLSFLLTKFLYFLLHNSRKNGAKFPTSPLQPILNCPLPLQANSKKLAELIQEEAEQLSRNEECAPYDAREDDPFARIGVCEGAPVRGAQDSQVVRF